jgi:hypothetical protein
MTKRRRLETDDLMIVNPGLPESGAVFLADDGTLYQIATPEEDEGLRYFLVDGTVYQLRGPRGLAAIDEEALTRGAPGELGPLFLGEDGTLYEIVE